MNVDDFLVMQFITQVDQTGKKTKMGDNFAEEKNGREVIFHGIRDDGSKYQENKVIYELTLAYFTKNPSSFVILPSGCVMFL